MEKSKWALRGLLAALAFLIAALFFSCNKIPVEVLPGTLSWSIEGPPATRSLVAQADTDDFLLLVRDPAGKTLYDGPYGASPVSLLVDPGTYTVRILSVAFDAPAFDTPQFGDEQAVVVLSGSETRVRLHCTQRNSGIRLVPSSDFAEAYPGGSFLISGSDGSLEYGMKEQRTAFFKPGNVDISLLSGKTTTPLMTRSLGENEMLSLGITCSSGGSSAVSSSNGFSVEVDTSRVWLSEDYSLGDGSGSLPGSSASNAYGVAQAREHAGDTEVWVCGFVVGGDLTSSKNGISFTPPFSSQTNIAIAARSSVTDKSVCLSVKLAKGEFRDRLNLVDHPELIGRKVYLKGDLIEAYYGIPGIQNISACLVDE